MACFNDSLFIEIITLVFITQLPKGVARTLFTTYVYGLHNDMIPFSKEDRDYLYADNAPECAVTLVNYDYLCFQIKTCIFLILTSYTLMSN